MLAFAGGALAGAVTALLLAPKRGEELRKDIKSKIGEAKAHLDAEIACCKAAAAGKGTKEDVIVSFEE